MAVFQRFIRNFQKKLNPAAERYEMLLEEPKVQQAKAVYGWRPSKREILIIEIKQPSKKRVHFVRFFTMILIAFRTFGAGR